MSKALAELNAAKTAIEKLQDDIRDVRTALAAQEQRGLTIEARLGAVEVNQKSNQMPVAHATPASQRNDGAKSNAAALSGQTTEGSIEERPTRVLREGPAPRIATASVTSVPATRPVEPAGPAQGLLLASGPSLDAVRLSWQLLNENNRATLRKYEPRFVESSTDGGLFQLIAGPAGTPDEAAKVCERLKTRHVRCSVTPFKGQPL